MFSNIRIVVTKHNAKKILFMRWNYMKFILKGRDFQLRLHLFQIWKCVFREFISCIIILRIESISWIASDWNCLWSLKMSCIHYKFKSSIEYDTLTFDGLHISLGELKKAIIQHKKLGKTNEFDLQVTNAQTKQGIFLYFLLCVCVCVSYE